MKRMTNGSEDWIYAYTADDERLFSYKVRATRFNRWTLRDLSGQVLREVVGILANQGSRDWATMPQLARTVGSHST
jgi:hypothetical protein